MSGAFTDSAVNCRNYYDVLLYPRTLTSLSVVDLVPLKIKASFHVSQLNKTFSASGMVCQRGFNNHAAQTTCHSLGHSKASFVRNLTIDEHEVCTLDDENASVRIPCQFILDKLNCTKTTVDLMQCSFAPIFSFGCKSNHHIGLTCVTPTTTTKRTTTKKLVTKATSQRVITSEASFNKGLPSKQTSG